MAWDFFANNQGQRAGGTPFPPPAGDDEHDDQSSPPELEYETKERQIPWRPLETRPGAESVDWPHTPLRFVDGKDNGRTVAWLRSPQGYPVAVRLGQIGAIVMRRDGGRLEREWHAVERVIALDGNLFPWDQIEGLARDLQTEGYRLLLVPPPHHEGQAAYTFECEPMRKAAQNRCTTEMTRLERQAVGQNPAIPTVVDGRLAPRQGGFGPKDPVLGVIKTHAQPYFQTREQWDVLYGLCPAQRTPAFRITTEKLQVVSFYVRLCTGDIGENLESGLVRVELSESYFKEALGRDWEALDRLGGLMAHYRCRDSSYGRAAISLHPIVRAEESLGSLFADADMLIAHFYNNARI